jgi:hypothetical protein
MPAMQDEGSCCCNLSSCSSTSNCMWSRCVHTWTESHISCMLWQVPANCNHLPSERSISCAVRHLIKGDCYVCSQACTFHSPQHHGAIAARGRGPARRQDLGVGG